jgi:hypothetical protein
LLRIKKRVLAPLLSGENYYTFFDKDNNYPQRVIDLYRKSVTVYRGVDIMTNFIVGNGVPELNYLSVNDKQNFYQFLRDLAKSYTLNRGAYIYADFNYLGEVFNYKVLPFENVRIAKKDDDGYSAKYYYKNDWNDKSEKLQEIYSWDTDENVIKERLKNKNGVSGMVFFLTDEPFKIYPLSRIHTVINDADTEVMISVFKNKTLSGGFFGKKIFILPKFVDEGIDKTSPLYRERQKMQTDLENKLKEFMGVDNIDTVMMLNLGVDEIEQLDKAFIVKDINSNVNPDLFRDMEKSLADNIRVVFNNVPDILLKTTAGIFGQSGEAYKQAKDFYTEQTEKERKTIELVLSDIFKNAQNEKFKEIDLKIIDL